MNEKPPHPFFTLRSRTTREMSPGVRRRGWGRRAFEWGADSEGGWERREGGEGEGAPDLTGRNSPLGRCKRDLYQPLAISNNLPHPLQTCHTSTAIHSPFHGSVCPIHTTGISTHAC